MCGGSLGKRASLVQCRCFMRKILFRVAVAFVVSFASLSVCRIRIVHLEQFCSNTKSWHVTFGPPNAVNLGLTSGVGYRASSYSLTNGFGLRPPGVSWLVVPFGPNQNGVIKFGP